MRSPSPLDRASPSEHRPRTSIPDRLGIHAVAQPDADPPHALLVFCSKLLSSLAALNPRLVHSAAPASFAETAKASNSAVAFTRHCRLGRSSPTSQVACGPDQAGRTGWRYRERPWPVLPPPPLPAGLAGLSAQLANTSDHARSCLEVMLSAKGDRWGWTDTAIFAPQRNR